MEFPRKVKIKYLNYFPVRWYFFAKVFVAYVQVLSVPRRIRAIGERIKALQRNERSKGQWELGIYLATLFFYIFLLIYFIVEYLPRFARLKNFNSFIFWKTRINGQKLRNWLNFLVSTSNLVSLLCLRFF